MWHLFIEVRRAKYLNNIVEQDHRGIKRVGRQILGLKSFEAAEETIAGNELHRMLKKGQMKNAKICLFGSNFIHWQPSCI